MIDDKMAVNTLKKYCNTSFKTCNKCAVKDACCMPYRVFGNMNEINDVGTFESWRKPSERPPKFDIRQKDSADFQKYINEIFLREAEKYCLPMNTANSIKWTARGTIVVTFVDDDNKTNYMGRAKCHPGDAFNLETGVRLAVHRMVQDANTPFDPHVGRVYYFINYDGNIMGKPWNDDAIDNCNMVLDNCFKSTFAAWLHITSVKRGIRHLADALRLTPPEPGKAGDADE